MEEILEQPQLDSTEQGTAVQLGEGSLNEQKTGSISKFKDTDELLRAYQSLEKEFTKKCQQLSEITKERQQDVIPAYQNQNWQERVDEFVSHNPSAKKYSQQISEMIINDKTIASSNNPLETAWAKIVDELKTPEQLLGDEKFVDDYILNNKEIQAKIIDNFLKKPNISPSLIGKQSGASTILAPLVKPKNLEEANEIVRSLLKD